jgi:hypothetical protein
MSEAEGDKQRSICGPEGEVIARCEEFTLYKNGWLASSAKVERALWRATLGISDRKGSENRMELALSLIELAERAAKPLRIEDANRRGSAPGQPDAPDGDEAKRNADLLNKLSGTLGKMLIPMLSVSRPSSTKKDSWKEARKEARIAAVRIRNSIASIHSATLAIARWKMSRPLPGENHPGAAVWVMQLVAKEIFRETRKRPSKHAIQLRLEEEGWGLDSKDAKSRWAKRFKDAGLEDLPDWTPPA